jgi:membrane associated rhomboid family serine protease
MSLRITPAVKAILIACLGLFVIQQTADRFLGGSLQDWFALIPSGVVINHRFWQLFTYAFLHADVTHLFLNMMMLVFIAGEIEAVWGTVRFLRYYFFCSISAGLLYLFLQMFVWGGASIHVPMVGASGAIYGLLLAYGFMFSERTLLFMLLFPMKAKHFVWVLAAIEFMTTVFSGRSGLSSAAHLGGMAAGFGYLWVKAAFSLYRKKQGSVGGRAKVGLFSRKGAQKKSHLKLIIDNEHDANRFNNDSDSPKTWH